MVNCKKLWAHWSFISRVTLPLMEGNGRGRDKKDLMEFHTGFRAAAGQRLKDYESVLFIFNWK